MAISVFTRTNTMDGSEYFFAAGGAVASYQATKNIVQAELDVSALAAGDEFLVKIYSKIDGVNARAIYTGRLAGVQTDGRWVSPAFVLENWEVGMVKVAGTNRSVTGKIFYVA